MLAHRMRRLFRTRQLRRSYLGRLRATAVSLDDRVRFHVDHLAEYWERCLGFARVSQPSTVLSGDLGVCVVIATRAAARDLAAFTDQRGLRELRIAWDSYLERFDETLSRPEGMKECVALFDRVRELHRQANQGASP